MTIKSNLILPFQLGLTVVSVIVNSIQQYHLQKLMQFLVCIEVIAATAYNVQEAYNVQVVFANDVASWLQY